MARVLVTGEAGFIGSLTVGLLLEKDYDVCILDALQPRVYPHGAPPWIPKRAEFIQGDVANRADLAPNLAGVDTIMHLAAYQNYLPDVSTFIHTNAESAALIFKLVVEAQLVGRPLPVREKDDAFFAGLAKRTAEVKRRCRRDLQAQADALVETASQLLAQTKHVDLTLESE